MKVAVAMSGGVDSSLAAALLKEAGHEVEGAYMLGYAPPGLPCPAADERRDAIEVAGFLGIPFHTVDLSAVYKREVVDYLLAEYEQGNTPNPDIMCNRHVKFGAFLEWANARGFDAIATGHYAQKRHDAALGRGLLVQGADRMKDQSYFLWGISRDALARTLFPVGAFQKAEVRQMAEARGIPTAAKKDSQGVCFLGKIDMGEFLAREIPHRRGAVLSLFGEVIGTHPGAGLLTVGQRHGFTLTVTSPHEKPHYVVAKDIEANTITVAEDPGALAPAAALGQRLAIGRCNWPSRAPAPGEALAGRIRYRQPLIQATVAAVTETAITVELMDPKTPIARGQSLVLYDRDVCLGGGAIEGRVGWV